jgi:hypothetical protein
MDLYQSCLEMEQPHTVNNVYKRAECTGYIAASMAAWLSGTGYACIRNIPNGINNLQLSMIYVKWVRDNPANARGLGNACVNAAMMNAFCGR